MFSHLPWFLFLYSFISRLLSSSVIMAQLCIRTLYNSVDSCSCHLLFVYLKYLSLCKEITTVKNVISAIKHHKNQRKLCQFNFIIFIHLHSCWKLSSKLKKGATKSLKVLQCTGAVPYIQAGNIYLLVCYFTVDQTTSYTFLSSRFFLNKTELNSLSIYSPFRLLQVTIQTYW